MGEAEDYIRHEERVRDALYAAGLSEDAERVQGRIDVLRARLPQKGGKDEKTSENDA